MERSYTHVFIIGNGFDLNLGLKTGYLDFVNSRYFQNLVNVNELCSHLSQKCELDKWIDIENELKLYSKLTKTSSNDFRHEFKELSNALMDYLNSLDYKNIDESSCYFKLLTHYASENILILDFNYTPVIKNILSQTLNRQNVDDLVLKMHGSLHERDIIFGVEDGADIKAEHVFLKKAYNVDFKGNDFSRILNNAHHIFICGHSLGVTDRMYFKDFFFNSSVLRNNNLPQNERVSINLFFWNENGYYDLLKEIDSLTNCNLSKFRQNNNFRVFDISRILRTDS